MRGAVDLRALALGVALIAVALGGCSNEPASSAPAEAAEQNQLSEGVLASAPPQQIRDAIDRYGASAVVGALFGHEGDAGWTRVIDHVASGDEAWLSLVVPLQPGADGHASESLHIAVSEALRHNAPAVLRLIATGGQDVRVCSMLAIEPTEEEVAQYYAAAISAVEAVREANLEAAKTACLVSLRNNRPATR